MKRYTIRYVDGHSLKYKIFETVADSEDEAISKLNKDGDFDHQIITLESEEIQPIMTIPVSIYEAKDMENCSNHGISERFKDILLVCPSGHIKATGEEENLCKVDFIGKRAFVRPFKDPEGVGWMDGGCVVYSHDSRFPSDYPLNLHDRQETQEMYNALSM